MKALGIVLAVLLHAGFILFGGLLVNASNGKVDHGTAQIVDLVDGNAIAVEKKKDDPKENADLEKKGKDEIKSDDEKPPDADSMIRELNTSAAVNAPRLDDLSLGAMEALLSGKGAAGASDFGGGGGLESGGVIGGTKGLRAGTLEEKAERAFNPNEIDQKPRVMFQAAPVYPAEMRDKTMEGVVSVLFIVDAAGKVVNSRVEKSNHPAFEKPALSAVKQWKFEPGIKGGQRVACKMRVSIRFPKS
jgi:TonB family protein